MGVVSTSSWPEGGSDQGFPPDPMSLLGGISDCIYCLDAQWRFTFLSNRAVAEIAGGRRLIGVSIWNAFPDTVGSLFEIHYRRAMNEKSRQVFEAFYPPLSAWYEVHAVPSGTGIAVFFRNVNDRRAASEALRARERQLETVFSQSMVGILHHDLKNQVLMINQRFCDILGRSREEIEGLSIQEFTHPEDAQWNMPLFVQRLQLGEPFQIEKRYLRPGGSWIWCAVNVSFVRDDTGEVASVIVIAQDIHERKVAEERTRKTQDLLQAVMDSVEDVIFVKDMHGRFVFVNKQVAGDRSLLGKRVQDLYPPELADGYIKADQPVLSKGEVTRVEETIPIKGAARQFQTVKVPWWQDNQIVGLIGVSRDMTEQLQAARELRESRRKLATLIDNLPGLVYAADPDLPWPITFISEGAAELTGYPADDFASHRVNWADVVYPEDLAELEEAVSQARQDQRPFSAVYRIITASNEIRWVLDRGQFTYAESGEAVSLDGFVGDITKQKQAEERIRWAAQHDPLTQLPNRALFNERLEAAVKTSLGTGCSLGLLFVDMDHLKQVNDTIGHDAGDCLIQEVANRLRKSVRDGDMVSRNGGDEFAILLPGLNGEAELNAVTESILKRLEELLIYGSRMLDCRVSIGASIWPKQGSKLSEVMKQADMALQAAKASGRGTARLFDPTMRLEAQRRAVMLNRARHAIDKRHIEPFYQPKVDLSTGELAGFEALLRWRDRLGNMKSPADIGAAFEDARFAIAMGQQIQDCVVEDTRKWLDYGIEFGHMAFNASAAEFGSGGFAEDLLERLRSAGIPTRCIEVEVVETVFVGRGAEYVEEALRTLHKEGVRIALDDFGTGYASLLHLKQFPVDVIKVDQSFVWGLARKPEDAAILSAVLALGRSLGMTTVAEGVETLDQAAFLRAAGCDLGQGYLFGKPTSRGLIPELIRSWDAEQQRRGW